MDDHKGGIVKGIELRVGMANADIVGQDNRALQAALDYVGNLGGGTVIVGPGVYLMANALRLHSNVTLRGQGDQTVLRKSTGFTSPLAADGDYGDTEAIVADPSGFRPGMGVMVTDERSGGFHTLVATIVDMEGNSLRLDGRHRNDYLMKRNAYASTAFPIISGRYVNNVRLEGLTIEGNRAQNALLNGCRGAGIYFHRAQDVVIASCTVDSFNGDGISFQQSEDVQVLDCLCQGNAALGLHPGSGSQRPVLRRCRSIGNGQIGLYFCWRVRHGVASHNELAGNGVTGLSIGHKDTDNLIENNVIADNGTHGILFRDELEPQGAHRNRVLGNTIRNNGNEREGYGIKIEGVTHDLLIRDNLIQDDRPADDRRQRIGIHVGAQASNIALEGNRFEGNAEQDIYWEGR